MLSGDTSPEITNTAAKKGPPARQGSAMALYFIFNFLSSIANRETSSVLPAYGSPVFGPTAGLFVAELTNGRSVATGVRSLAIRD